MLSIHLVFTRNSTTTFNHRSSRTPLCASIFGAMNLSSNYRTNYTWEDPSTARSSGEACREHTKTCQSRTLCAYLMDKITTWKSCSINIMNSWTRHISPKRDKSIQILSLWLRNLLFLEPARTNHLRVQHKKERWQPWTISPNSCYLLPFQWSRGILMLEGLTP